jgi:Polyketide cyclase / dehydrase and lipid transport
MMTNRRRSRLRRMHDSAARRPRCFNEPMGRVTAIATRELPAPPERVLELVRDYRETRRQLLPDNYSAYRVEAGGKGAGTVIGYHFTAGRRERDYRLRVQEADGMLTEQDELSSFVSVWTVTAAATGTQVTLEGSWNGATGIGGVMEGLFAPLGLRRIYGEILDRLAAAVAVV